MMTRYFTATAALLIYATVHTGGPITRKSERLGGKKSALVVVESVKAPEAYTFRSQRMQIKNGDTIISRIPKKNYALGGPRIKLETPEQATHDFTTSPSHISLNNIPSASAYYIDVDGECIEEEIDNEEEMLTTSSSFPVLPGGYEETSSTSSSLSALPSVDEEMVAASDSLPVLPIVHNTVETRNPLLTVSSGGVTKPRGKGLSRSMPTLSTSSIESNEKPSSFLRSFSPAPKKINGITEELMRKSSHFNAIVETMIKCNQPIDAEAQRWYAITKNLKAGISKRDQTYIEANKFKMQKWSYKHQ